MSERRRIEIYDTTLRDGTQGEGFNLSLQDKLQIAQKLDELGVDYIEGGYPLSNPKDEAFFRDVRGLNLRNAKVSAFGMTRKRGVKAEDDAGNEISIELGQKATEVIDATAQKRGYTDSDRYMAEWKWSDEQERPGSADEVAETLKQELMAKAGLKEFCRPHVCDAAHQRLHGERIAWRRVDLRLRRARGRAGADVVQQERQMQGVHRRGGRGDGAALGAERR
jgi:hypothetical protein